MNGITNIGLRAGILALRGHLMQGLGSWSQNRLSSVQCLWAGVMTSRGPKSVSAP